MIAVCVTFIIRPDAMTAFMDAMTRQARVSLDREPGCRQFDVCTGGDDRRAVFLYEIYEDRAAFDVHLASEHFREFDARVAGYVENKRVEIFDQARRGL